MTSFIGGAMPVNILRPDRSAIDESRWCRVQCPRVPRSPIPPRLSMKTRWWPSRSGFIGDGGADVSMLARLATNDRRPSGSNARLAFVGYARDWAGNVMPNATVRCFLTSTVVLVSTVSSDANGYYAATTPYGGAHFLTVHGTASGVPVSGASVDTLVPG